ncbi:MAG: single-stranded DNA-binding protein [Bacteroidaceae bacterium]|nr:single-stranded DNA-binding protein [Bacteroidaceae bacterium]
MNKAILIGNVGRDPNVKYFEGGRAVAQLPLATTERGYTLQNGTVVPDRTEWHNLVFRNGLAQTVEKYVHKGDKLYVEGKILTRSYDDQSGIKRYVTEIYVDEMEMLTPKGAQASVEPQAPAAQQPVAGAASEETPF